MATQTDNAVASVFLPPPNLGSSIQVCNEQALGEGKSRPVPVTEPTQPGDVERDGFVTAYVIVVNSLTRTLAREIATACGESADHLNENRRIEVCAAVWATIQAAFRASLLTDFQRRTVINALDCRLHSRGREGLGADDGSAGRIEARTNFYLQHVDPHDPITTAVRIVDLLLDANQVPPEHRAVQTRLLAGLLAHRIVSDVWLFNDWVYQGKLAAAQSPGI